MGSPILTLRNLLCHIPLTQKYEIRFADVVVQKVTSDFQQFCELDKQNEAIERNLDTHVTSFISIDDVLTITVDLWEE